MCFFRKKKTGAKAKEDRELVNANSKAIEALLLLAQKNDDLVKDLKRIQEKLKYLIPTENAKVLDYDKAIKNKIGDLRIVLTKSEGETTKKASDLLLDIEMTVADRNAKIREL